MPRANKTNIKQKTPRSQTSLQSKQAIAQCGETICDLSEAARHDEEHDFKETA